MVSFPKFCKFYTCSHSRNTCKVGYRTDHSPTNRPGRKSSDLEPLYHRSTNYSVRTLYLATLTSPFFVQSWAVQSHRQFGNYPEIVMKSICVNSSANLPQVFEISTKTKFAYCVKNSLPMFLLMPLVLAWPRPTYEINGGSTL